MPMKPAFDAVSATTLCAQGSELMRQRRFEAAEPLFRRALQLDARSFPALSALGLIALERNNLAQAIDLLNQACAVDARQPTPFINLGNAQARAGKYTEAIVSYNAALKLAPNDVEAHFNRSTALLYANRFAEAFDGYKRVLRIAPNHPGSLFNFATAALNLGRLDDTVLACRRLLQLGNEDLDILMMLLRVFSLRRNIGDAQEPMARAVAVASAAIDEAGAEANGSLQKVVQLSQLMLELEGAMLALALVDRALVKFPRSAELHFARGRVLADLMRQSEAVESYDAALTLDPRLTSAFVQRGTALVQLGKFNAAVASYDRALLAGDQIPNTLIELVAAKRFTSEAEPHFHLITDLARKAQTLSPPDQVLVHFAAGKACDDVGFYDDAFAHWTAGNRTKRQLAPYDVSADLEFSAQVIRTFDAAWVDSRVRRGQTGGPIFVFGMPRSGTTLVEQMIGGHPDVAATGETGFFQRAVRRVLNNRSGGASSLEKSRTLSDAEQAEIGRSYLALAEQRGGGARRVVDKTLWSSHNAALIAAALPNAALIHVRRDPMDNCLACFSKLFATGHQYTDDLDDLGRYRLSYDTLIEHWRRVLPADRFLEVEYEALVYNFEREARRVIEFCGLSWTSDVLDFTRLDRPVGTASAFQVRQGLFSSSIGRWRHYGNHLEPLDRLFARGPSRQAAMS